MSQKYLVGINTKEMPGRVILTWLHMDTEVIRADESITQREDFLLLDKGHPIVRQITELFA